jgi:hypothetical protein
MIRKHWQKNNLKRKQMENKYFTPDIEDFHVGYECEILKENWEHFVFNVEEIIPVFARVNSKTIVSDKIRVPYLTKEQIEAEGWTEFITEYRGDIKLENMNYVFFNEKSNYMLGWFFNRNQIGLLVKDPAKALDINGNIINYNDAPRYTGECKDINTFRKIIKLLGI